MALLNIFCYFILFFWQMQSLIFKINILNNAINHQLLPKFSLNLSQKLNFNFKNKFSFRTSWELADNSIVWKAPKQPKVKLLKCSLAWMMISKLCNFGYHLAISNETTEIEISWFIFFPSHLFQWKKLTLILGVTNDNHQDSKDSKVPIACQKSFEQDFL